MTGRVSGAPFPGPSHPRRHTRWGTDPLAAASPAPAPHGSSHNKEKKGGWGERAKAPSPAARIALSFLRSRGEQATQGGKCQERRSHEPTEGHGGFAGSAGSDKENQRHIPRCFPHLEITFRVDMPGKPGDIMLTYGFFF